MVFLGKLCINPRLNPLERVYPAAGRASQLFLYSQMVRKTPSSLCEATLALPLRVHHGPVILDNALASFA